MVGLTPLEINSAWIGSNKDSAPKTRLVENPTRDTSQPLIPTSRSGDTTDRALAAGQVHVVHSQP